MKQDLFFSHFLAGLGPFAKNILQVHTRNLSDDLVIDLYFMILFDIWIAWTDVSAKTTFNFAIIDSDSIVIPIILNELSHCIAFLDPSNNSNLITDRSD